MQTAGPLLDLRVSADYPGHPGVLDNLEFQMERGQVLGLVGESGSGKSTIALSILRLLAFKGGTVRGQVRFQDRDLMTLSERQMRSVRGREIALVLQSPLCALNPALRISAQLLESWRAHQSGSSRPAPNWLDWMEMVNLPAEQSFIDRYPRQLSVGQAQRVLIAMSIVHRPALLIADEATSALDAVTQSEILKLFSRLNREMGMAVLYISHDLLSVASFCHRVAILRQGRIVESNPVHEIFHNPRTPYTRTLLASIPKLPTSQVQDTPAYA